MHMHAITQRKKERKKESKKKSKEERKKERKKGLISLQNRQGEHMYTLSFWFLDFERDRHGGHSLDLKKPPFPVLTCRQGGGSHVPQERYEKITFGQEIEEWGTEEEPLMKSATIFSTWRPESCLSKARQICFIIFTGSRMEEPVPHHPQP